MTPADPVTVESPRHPLHALTTFELRRYRRQLENAIAFFDGRGTTVIPIATATSRPGEPIEVGRAPGSIVITPDGKTAYVAAGGHPGTVTPIATATNTPGPPIQVGDGPDGIAMTPDGKTVYVVCTESNAVIQIATATGTAGPPIQAGVRPRAIVITPDGATAYVLVWDEPGMVIPITTGTNHPRYSRLAPPEKFHITARFHPESTGAHQQARWRPGARRGGHGEMARAGLGSIE
jgi:DNA-binding beta-propeller fold protein YncE